MSEPPHPTSARTPTDPRAEFEFHCQESPRSHPHADSTSAALTTKLTRRLGIRAPILGAPMAGVANGALAGAISAAGGLGLIGVGNAQSAESVREEAAIAAERATGRPYGIGLQLWSLPNQPGVFDAVLAARPALVSVSFGDPGPYVGALHQIGATVAAQVNSVADAERAAAGGVDVLVAQGTEAGGHTGAVSTLPLLQAVLARELTGPDVTGPDGVLPVVAAGGIGDGRGLAAVLAAGAQAAWIGTRFLAATEAANTAAARERVIDADETRTVHTRIFDVAQGLAWPERYPGRALRNTFTDTWANRESELAASQPERGREVAEAKRADDFDTAVVYAGQASALVTAEQPAAEIVAELVAGAAKCLRIAACLVSADPT